MKITNAQRLAKNRTRWTQENICNRCGKNPKPSDHLTCQSCRDSQREYYHANKENHATYRNIRKGLCATCGKQPPHPGTYQGKKRTTCADCCNKRNLRVLERRLQGNRYKAVQRDKFLCQLCASPKQIIIHHIDGQGDTSGKPNDIIDNLIALCRRCHGAITILRCTKVNKEHACSLILE